ncbi:MAG: ureidoglycolate lyase [Proteobacteria bacterium]|nr:ureidoglycolate lyase [Pseudomonadota bacterium]
MRVKLAPLAAEVFAPFGTVAVSPAEGLRADLSGALQNWRSDARARLSLNNRPPTALPHLGPMMERHPYSSQTFMPLQVSRYLAIVAPPGPGGGPDLRRLLGFVASGKQVVSYNAATWHFPLTVLDTHGKFAVLMWTVGHDDTEFVTLPEPLEIDPV